MNFLTPPALAARPAAGSADAPPTELRLLERLELRCAGSVIDLPEASQRLLAFLALRGGPQHRSTVAGTLWLDHTEDRAAANLRTALWRLRKLEAEVVHTDGAYLQVADEVEIDLTDVMCAARELTAEPQSTVEPATDAATLAKDLLPDWCEDWVLLERERLRQVRLHALEALCRRLTSLGRFAGAIEAGLLAVEVEPLRESSQRALIGAHLAEGNPSEAVRQFRAYRDVLHEQLGIEPTAELRAMVTA